ncbi:MAG TPA: glycosyltransferase family 2 protein, partial [Candidatus Bathyarchaeia archaeon]
MERRLSPHVSVIIVHVRGFEPLTNTLKSVLNSSYDNLEVILVDNGSTDGSIGLVHRSFGDRIRILRTAGNVGFVKGCNYALERVQADYVVLLNDDTVVEPDWLNQLVEVAESDSSIAACQPKLKMLKSPDYFEYNGACGGMIDLCGIPFTRGRLFDRAEEDFGQYDKKVEVFWASGAAMFLRYRAAREVGYLDDLFYFHMEEIDLSWRLRMRGYKVVSVPSSVVYHLGGATPVPRTSFLKHRNNLLMLAKNYSWQSLAVFLPIRLFMDAGYLAYLSLKGRYKFGLDAFASYAWILRSMKKVIQARRASQKIRVAPDKAIRSSMAKPSVAFQYYILGRHAFSQLSGL